MDIKTDYRCNLDVLHACPHVSNKMLQPHDIIQLNMRSMIMLQRGLVYDRSCKPLLFALESAQKNHGRVFLRMSTISAKDVAQKNCNAYDMLQTFSQSERIQSDLVEAIERGFFQKIYILPYVDFIQEYRSFVKDGKYSHTQSQSGKRVINNDVFKTFSKLICHNVIDLPNQFVFDVGLTRYESDLYLIEINQWDESTDLYQFLN